MTDFARSLLGDILSSSEPAWGFLWLATRHRDVPGVTFAATPDRVAAAEPGLVYLATPYSRIARDDHGNWSRYGSVEAMERAGRHAARLCKAGVTAISPIVLSADICHTDATLDPLDADFWHRWCAPLLAACHSVVVPDIPGWDASLGIWHEVRRAHAVWKPVHVYADGV